MTPVDSSEQTPRRLLIVGYGNPYRHDDGAAFYVVNHIRQAAGLQPLDPDDTGEDETGGPIDCIMPTGLTLDLVPLVSSCDLVVFVDTHGVVEAEPFRVQPVEEEHRLQSVTHHLSPGLLIRLVRDMTGAKPKAFLVSVRGYDFDFGDGLTDACSANVLCATARILQMIGKG